MRQPTQSNWTVTEGIPSDIFAPDDETELEKKGWTLVI